MRTKNRFYVVIFILTVAMFVSSATSVFADRPTIVEVLVDAGGFFKLSGEKNLKR